MSQYVENLVLIPGLNNTKQAWSGVMEALPASVNKYAVDVPAMTDINQIAEELLNTLPETFHLAGHSFGGFIALAMLEMAPERISGLSLIGTNANAEKEEVRELRKKAIARALSGEYEEMISAASHRTFHPDNLGNEDLQILRKQMIEDYGVERYAAHAEATMNRPDRSKILTEVDIPYLFVSSIDDIIVPLESTKEMLQYAPKAEFVIIENSGHLIPLEQPKALAVEMLPWLEKK
ncbi:alpha/beta hydrolase [Sporosarcina sp. P3]|uniref:alpha/beta fold hydrolase n=1 Tax=Sporosarcina sp. P3 TaxID=2048245 RepID=UPI000C1663CA|nr:alpha/beta hydrolase [Sporosarcina sp. P3]PID20954.1 alpha/beta hydrolase [Sporosarcina sp. P3]